MSPLQELEARFDGRIPPALRQAAMAAEAAYRAIPRFQVRTRIKHLNERFALAAMTTVIADAFISRGVCTRDDLIRAGFAEADIARYGDQAVRIVMADARADRQVSDA